MAQSDVGVAIAAALESAGLSQRMAQERTGISQATLSRITSGRRSPKMTEIIRIADATGFTVAQLTGSAISDRIQCAARSTNGANMDAMRRALVHYVELDAYLDDQAIPAPF